MCHFVWMLRKSQRPNHNNIWIISIYKVTENWIDQINVAENHTQLKYLKIVLLLFLVLLIVIFLVWTNQGKYFSILF